jgi:phosphoribosylanthranilate isomerase
VAGDVPVVGVFVDAPLDAIEDAVARSGVRMVQLHGDEPESLAASLPWPVLRATGVDSAGDTALDGAASRGWPGATLLLDAVSGDQRGGTGLRVDWTKAATVARGRQVVLAGGLTPENVAAAIAAVRPFGVDVSSGVERAVGRKDSDKVTRFLDNARDAFARLGAAPSAR